MSNGRFYPPVSLCGLGRYNFPVMSKEHRCRRVAHLQRECWSILKLGEMEAREAMPECISRPFADTSATLGGFPQLP